MSAAVFGQASAAKRDTRGPGATNSSSRLCSSTPAQMRMAISATPVAASGGYARGVERRYPLVAAVEGRDLLVRASA